MTRPHESRVTRRTLCALLLVALAGCGRCGGDDAGPPLPAGVDVEMKVSSDGDELEIRIVNRGQARLAIMQPNANCAFRALLTVEGGVLVVGMVRVPPALGTEDYVEFMDPVDRAPYVTVLAPGEALEETLGLKGTVDECNPGRVAELHAGWGVKSVERTKHTLVGEVRLEAELLWLDPKATLDGRDDEHQWLTSGFDEKNIVRVSRSISPPGCIHVLAYDTSYF